MAWEQYIDAKKTTIQSYMNNECHFSLFKLYPSIFKDKIRLPRCPIIIQIQPSPLVPGTIH